MEAIEDKINKLLALANDRNDEESQTALLMAQKLMLKHNIQINQYRMKDKTPGVKNDIVLNGKYPNWVYSLADIISQNFRTKFYYVQFHHRTEFHFLGIEQDVDIAKSIFLYAYASIKYHSNIFVKRPEIKRKYKRKYSLKRDYITGYINGLSTKLKEQVVNESLELALTLHPVVQSEINSLELVPGKDRSKEIEDLTAFRMGYHDGKTFKKDVESIEGY